MSKIGRKPIDITNTQVDIKGQEIHYKGKFASGIYVLPEYIKPTLQDKILTLSLLDKAHNNFWGLHRALLANQLKGASELFEKKLQIIGLGFKAELLNPTRVKLSLGYSHKIEQDLPKGVTLELDKPGQMLTFKSSNKEALGQICATIRSFRPPEPYKGTGIKLTTEVIKRKAGKTKAA